MLFQVLKRDWKETHQNINKGFWPVGLSVIHFFFYFSVISKYSKTSGFLIFKKKSSWRIFSYIINNTLTFLFNDKTYSFKKKSIPYEEAKQAFSCLSQHTYCPWVEQKTDFKNLENGVKSYSNVSYPLGTLQTFPHCWWECKLVHPPWKTVWKILKKLKIELL